VRSQGWGCGPTCTVWCGCGGQSTGTPMPSPTIVNAGSGALGVCPVVLSGRPGEEPRVPRVAAQVLLQHALKGRQAPLLLRQVDVGPWHRRVHARCALQRVGLSQELGDEHEGAARTTPYLHIRLDLELAEEQQGRSQLVGQLPYADALAAVPRAQLAGELPHLSSLGSAASKATQWNRLNGCREGARRHSQWKRFKRDHKYGSQVTAA
jgi:hypothetical protein